jgi:hypothetical protein
LPPGLARPAARSGCRSGWAVIVRAGHRFRIRDPLVQRVPQRHRDLAPTPGSAGHGSNPTRPAGKEMRRRHPRDGMAGEGYLSLAVTRQRTRPSEPPRPQCSAAGGPRRWPDRVRPRGASTSPGTDQPLLTRVRAPDRRRPGPSFLRAADATFNSASTCRPCSPTSAAASTTNCRSGFLALLNEAW